MLYFTEVQNYLSIILVFNYNYNADNFASSRCDYHKRRSAKLQQASS